ncbi:MAG: phytoene/squalene synthase family protein [Bdellovibrionaceae bacterium]|nr:phytoene/squalene synthase family protein [Bdellovibrio sp.]
MSNELVEVSKNDIKKGSKSFSLASFFFSKKQKEAAWMLYAWCRYCDDVIDNSATLHEAQVKTIELKTETEKCYNHQASSSHPWVGVNKIIHEYDIPSKYPLDLLRGFQIDASGHGISSKSELLDYCYCVAGTVGLMMCHIMGISDARALQNAVDLGTAMQLTNIARDIKDDHLINRVYLPDEWLAEAGLDRSNFFFVENRLKLKLVVDRLLSEADQLYESGQLGLKYLSLRSAWAVGIALFVYRDIGRQVRAGGVRAFDNRVVVTKSKKIFLLVCSSFKILSLLPGRLIKPWKATNSNEIRSVT